MRTTEQIKPLTRKHLNELTYELIGAAIEVQKTLGRGLLESIYHDCMKEELEIRKIKYKTELSIPVFYKSRKLETGFRCDLFIEDSIVLELKAVTEMHPIFETQLLTYMKLLQAPKGILLNFNSTNIFKEGQKIFVNEYFSNLSENS